MGTLGSEVHYEDPDRINPMYGVNNPVFVGPSQAWPEVQHNPQPDAGVWTFQIQKGDCKVVVIRLFTVLAILLVAALQIYLILSVEQLKKAQISTQSIVLQVRADARLVTERLSRVERITITFNSIGHNYTLKRINELGYQVKSLGNSLKFQNIQSIKENITNMQRDTQEHKNNRDDQAKAFQEKIRKNEIDIKETQYSFNTTLHSLKGKLEILTMKIQNLENRTQPDTQTSSTSDTKVLSKKIAHLQDKTHNLSTAVQIFRKKMKELVNNITLFQDFQRILNTTALLSLIGNVRTLEVKIHHLKDQGKNWTRYINSDDQSKLSIKIKHIQDKTLNLSVNLENLQITSQVYHMKMQELVYNMTIFQDFQVLLNKTELISLTGIVYTLEEKIKQLEDKGNNQTHSSRTGDEIKFSSKITHLQDKIRNLSTDTQALQHTSRANQLRIQELSVNVSDVEEKMLNYAIVTKQFAGITKELIQIKINITDLKESIGEIDAYMNMSNVLEMVKKQLSQGKETSRISTQATRVTTSIFTAANMKMSSLVRSTANTNSQTLGTLASVLPTTTHFDGHTTNDQLSTKDYRTSTASLGFTRAPDVQCRRNYLELSDVTRISTYISTNISCDRSGPNPDWKGNNWYRFRVGSGRMATSPPGSRQGHYKCNTHAAGWMVGEHPSTKDGVVNRQVCFDYLENSCQWKTTAMVVKCASFYLYYLQETPYCYLRYCAAG